MYKYKLLILFILFLSIFCISKTSALLNLDNNLIGKVIYLDPGHGGIDPGAVYKDIKESDINLKFSKNIGKKLEKMGVIVLYTREDDYDLASTTNNRKKSDLSNRVKLINESNADMYISIHVNSESSSTWYGAQVFYSNKNDKNKKIAELFQNELNNSKISKRKISKINNVYMYDRLNKPGILLEVGFISNYADRHKMLDDEYVDKFSNIIIDGIKKYFCL